MSYINSFSLDDFNNVIIDAIRFYPKKELICEMPQTFLCINDKTELDSENAEKNINDYYAGTYWSKHLGKVNNPSSIIAKTPIVALLPLDVDLINYYNKSLNRTYCYEFQLSVLDSFSSQCVKDPACRDRCKNRTAKQIQQDAINIMQNILHYVDSICRFKVTENIDGTEITNYIWVPVNVKNALEKKYPSRVYEHDIAATNGFHKNFRVNNRRNDRMTFVDDLGVRNLYGVYIPIELCIKTCVDHISEFNFSDTNLEHFNQDCCG